MNFSQLNNGSFNIFSDRNDFIDPIRLYYACYRELATVKSIDRLDLTKVRKWMEAQQGYKILNKYSKQQYCRKQKEIRNAEIFYLLEGDIILYLYYDEAKVLHNASREKQAADLLLELRRFTTHISMNENINVVISGAIGGLRTKGLKIAKPVMQLEKYYNDQLVKDHITILKQLKTNSKSGLHLFYGPPGTGKSTYIRYLIRSFKKKVIFLPANLAGRIDNPELIELLVNNSNAVFIIEDSEDLIKSREAGRNSSISMLLNLTDGLLGECLGIQVIATFNTDLCNIDKALLRKGRLLSLYEFNALSVDKSRTLLQELGHHQYIVTKEMTLAEIFNLKAEEYQLKKDNRNLIGFVKQTV